MPPKIKYALSIEEDHVQVEELVKAQVTDETVAELEGRIPAGLTFPASDKQKAVLEVAGGEIAVAYNRLSVLNRRATKHQKGGVREYIIWAFGLIDLAQVEAPRVKEKALVGIDEVLRRLEGLAWGGLAGLWEYRYSHRIGAGRPMGISIFP